MNLLVTSYVTKFKCSDNLLSSTDVGCIVCEDKYLDEVFAKASDRFLIVPVKSKDVDKYRTHNNIWLFCIKTAIRNISLDLPAHVAAQVRVVWAHPRVDPLLPNISFCKLLNRGNIPSKISVLRYDTYKFSPFLITGAAQEFVTLNAHMISFINQHLARTGMQYDYMDAVHGVFHMFPGAIRAYLGGPYDYIQNYVRPVANAAHVSKLRAEIGKYDERMSHTLDAYLARSKIS